MDQCPCGSEKPFAECCEPLLSGEAAAETAEALLRSRFTAFTRRNIDYIMETTHPDQIQPDSRKGIEKWSRHAVWQRLEIIDVQAGGPEDDAGTIEFKGDYIEKGVRQKHHELAEFKKKDGRWYFFDGKAPEIKQFVRTGPKLGRNDPCPCGSGKKFKKCCG